MSFRDKPSPQQVSITRNRYGYSIEIDDPDPFVRYMPVDPAVVRRAVREADREWARQEKTSP
jgi:hypothetical protein